MKKTKQNKQEAEEPADLEINFDSEVPFELPDGNPEGLEVTGKDSETA
jgi:hypothetical protein